MNDSSKKDPPPEDGDFVHDNDNVPSNENTADENDPEEIPNGEPGGESEDGEGTPAASEEDSDRKPRRRHRRDRRFQWNREMTIMLLTVMGMIAVPLVVVIVAMQMFLTPPRDADIDGINTDGLRASLENAADETFKKPSLRDNLIELSITEDSMLALGAKLEITAERLGGRALLFPLTSNQKGLRYLVTLPVGSRAELEMILTSVGPPPPEKGELPEGTETELLDVRLNPVGQKQGAKMQLGKDPEPPDVPEEGMALQPDSDPRTAE